jgi:hypothetical protein
LLACGNICLAQQVVPSGGYSLNSDVSVDWVLGTGLSASADDATREKPENSLPVEAELLSFKVYPSPAIDVFYVEIPAAMTGQYWIDLLDNSGKVVLKHLMMNQTLIKVDIHNFPKGILHIKAYDVEQEYLLHVAKVIKLKSNPL